MKKNINTTYDAIQIKRSNKKGFIAFIMIFIAIMSFIGGYFFNNVTKDPNARTIEWVIDTINKHGYYFDEETGEFKTLTAEEIADNIVSSFLDKYSDYYTAEEYSEVVATNKGNVYGVGLSFLKDETNLKIFRVTNNSPAFHAGMQKNDVLVGGKSANGERKNFTTRADFVDFSKEIPEKEEFTLYVDRDGTEESFVVSKQVFISSYVLYYDNLTVGTFIDDGKNGLKFVLASSDKMQHLPDGVAYIKYDSFKGKSAFEIKTVMEHIRAQAKTGIILDLRDNGGGLMSILSEVSSYFIKKPGVEKPVIAYAEEADGRLTHFNATGSYFVDSVQKISVIANNNTASASECLIGAMLWYAHGFSARNLVIEKGDGATGRTYGKGIMQSTFIRPTTGEALKLTVAKIYWPNKATCIHGIGYGVDEDNTVHPTKALDRAIQIMKG